MRRGWWRESGVERFLGLAKLVSGDESGGWESALESAAVASDWLAGFLCASHLDPNTKCEQLIFFICTA